MSYFLLKNSESCFYIKKFITSDELVAYIDDYFEGCTMRFLNHIPKDMDEFYEDDLIVIKGEIIEPKPIEIVKTYKID
jgi:hypothetical protein